MDAKVILESLYYLAKRIGHPIEKLAAVKLLFFADRYHLRKYGRLISEDTYYALPHGPVASNSLNIINEILINENAGVDREYLKRESVKSFSASSEEYELEYLSDTDKEALSFAVEHFGNMDTWDLRNLTHDYPEWKRYKHTLENELSKREPIVMSDFFEDSGIAEDPFEAIPKRAVELSRQFYLHI